MKWKICVCVSAREEEKRNKEKKKQNKFIRKISNLNFVKSKYCTEMAKQFPLLFLFFSFFLFLFIFFLLLIWNSLENWNISRLQLLSYLILFSFMFECEFVTFFFSPVCIIQVECIWMFSLFLFNYFLFDVIFALNHQDSQVPFVQIVSPFFFLRSLLSVSFFVCIRSVKAKVHTHTVH